MAGDGSRDAALGRLRDAVAGDVLTAADAGYDQARAIFNGMIDRRPGVIVQCERVQDVAAALLGRDHGLEIAVRGGGHSVAGKALTDGGIVVDLRRMRAVSVDPQARTATVAGGATMSDLDRATQPHGLATTGGRVSTTGVGGFTLGGGTGWLDRKLGLACDNLLAVEPVTADGSTRTASDQEHPELFWALHGGGLLYLTGPPEDFVPERLVGRLTLAMLITYAGGEADARAAMAPMLALRPAGQMLAEMPYADLQSMLDDPPGYRNYWSAEYLEAVPDEVVERSAPVRRT